MSGVQLPLEGFEKGLVGLSELFGRILREKEYEAVLFIAEQNSDLRRMYTAQGPVTLWVWEGKVVAIARLDDPVGWERAIRELRQKRLPVDYVPSENFYSKGKDPRVDAIYAAAQAA